MNLSVSGQAREERFAAYVDALAEGLGHADRIAPMQAYCTGLLLLEHIANGWPNREIEALMPWNYQP